MAVSTHGTNHLVVLNQYVPCARCHVNACASVVQAILV